MLTVLDVITRWLRIAVPILILAVLATLVAACEDGEPAISPSVTDYELGVLDWYGGVYLPARSEFRESVEDWLSAGEESPAAMRAGFLAKAYKLKGALSRAPAVEPPSGYERFDEELRGQMAMCGQGVDLLIGGIEADDEVEWRAGWDLVSDECFATSELWCYLPASSKFSLLCPTPTPAN